MKTQKITYLILFLLFACILSVPKADADDPCATESAACCTILNNGDQQPPRNSTLRNNIENGFNRTISRQCHRKIDFFPTERDGSPSRFSIPLVNTISLTNNTNFSLLIDGDTAGSVLIDGSGLGADQCLFQLVNSNSLWRGLTIKAHNVNKIFCDNGQNNDFSGVDIITDSNPNPHPYSICGNRKIESRAGEQCDNGADNNDTLADACRTSCRNPSCGDRVKDSTEQCDAGNSNSDTLADSCRTNCRNPSCGDRVKDTGEECDNGANNSDALTDACRTTCKNPSCGDSIKDTGEECDNGRNNNNTTPNACRTTCKNPSCGDGVKDTGEECDGGDNCENNCKLKSQTPGGGSGTPPPIGGGGSPSGGVPPGSSGPSDGSPTPGTGSGSSGGCSLFTMTHNSLPQLSIFSSLFLAIMFLMGYRFYRSNK